VSARNDRGHAGAHWTFADLEFSLAANQGRKPDFNPGDIRDRVQLSWNAIERNSESAGADGWFRWRRRLRFSRQKQRGEKKHGAKERKRLHFDPTRMSWISRHGKKGLRHPERREERERLPYSHTPDMVNQMKTTLNIDDTVMARLRQEAARQKRTMSELVEAALRLLFQTGRQQAKKKKLPPLPRFHGGKHLVDIADRNALYDVMEGRR
jgi:hypothetical protein